MRNNKDILKKILLHMKYDSKKTLSENNKVIESRKNMLSEDDEYLTQDTPSPTRTPYELPKPLPSDRLGKGTDLDLNLKKLNTIKADKIESDAGIVNQKLGKKNPGNSAVLTRIKSCVDGTTFVFPGAYVSDNEKMEVGEVGGESVDTKFKVMSADEWYTKQKKLKDKKQTNGIDACLYYIEMIRQKQIREKKTDPNDSKSVWFQEQFAICISESVTARNYAPPGCDSFFYVSPEIGAKLLGITSEKAGSMEVMLSHTDWWKAKDGYAGYAGFAYWDEWYEEEGIELPPLIPFKSPADCYLEKAYSIRYGTSVNKVDVWKLETITNKELLTKDRETIQNVDSGVGTLDIEKTLPYKDSEVDAMLQNNVINQDGTVKGVDYGTNHPWCLKDGVTYVNMRKLPGVNMDTGLFDVGSLGPGWDNFVGWKSNKVVGSDTGNRELLWLPMYEYYTANESGVNVYKRFNNKNVNDFLDKVSDYAKSNKKTFDIKNRSTKKDGATDYSINLLKPYLEDTDLSAGDVVSSVFQTVMSLGTRSGSRNQVIPPNTVVNDKNIMAWALDSGVAKYWLEIKLADGSGTVWVAQKNIEPCRLRKEDLSYENSWDKEMKNAEMVSSGNKIYYKTETIKKLIDSYKKEKKYSGKTEDELKQMAEQRWVKLQSDPPKGYKVIDDTKLHTSFESERMRNLPIVPMVIPK
jgi:hypothetical protein